MTLDRDLRLRLQQESADQRQRVREVIAGTDHPDKDKIVAEFDRNMWDIETGVMQARATWGALSQAQRRVVLWLAGGGYLARSAGRGTAPRFHIRGIGLLGCTCGEPTVKNLLARKLIESDNPSDPMKRLVLSDHGRFVLKHGRKETDNGQ